jgi:hypothetical protein
MSNNTRPATYSVSRLKTFHICSMLYKYKYVDRIKVDSLTKATLLGSCLHQILEDTYKPYINLTNPPIALSSNLIIQGTINTLTNAFVHDLTEQVNEVHKNYLLLAHLYKRADEHYTGKDAIRKADGTVAQAPEMTGTWKREVASYNLEDTKERLDSYIKSVDARWDTISFYELVMDVFKIAYKFTLDARIKKILATELEFSPETNVLITPFTGKDGPILEAYIDLIVELDDGEVAIIDYKSSSQAYKEVDIDFNSQLHMYSYAYETFFKTKAKYIGIYNLRDNSLVVSRMQPIIRQEVLKQLVSAHTRIKNNKFEKRLPNRDVANACPCLDQFHKPCAYLALCYPNLASKL